MELKRKPVIVVEESDLNRFQDECARLILADYKLSSSSCGFVNSEAYDFCSAYHAVFIDNLLR